MVFSNCFCSLCSDNEGADFPLRWFNIGVALAEISWYVRLLSWLMNVFLSSILGPSSAMQEIFMCRKLKGMVKATLKRGHPSPCLAKHLLLRKRKHGT